VTRAVLAVLAAWAALGASPGLAAPTPLITAPAGWHRDPEQAAALAQRFAAAAHFGGLATVTAAEAYVADQPGVALFVTRATATIAAPAAPAAPAASPGSGDPAAAERRTTAGPGDPRLGRLARAALDELRGSSRRAALTGGSAEEHGWQDRAEPEARQVTATLTWTDTTTHAVETARVVVASDGTRIVAVTGECLAGDAADRALAAACQAALGSLDPGVAAASRVELVLGSDPSADPAAAAAGPPDDRPAPPVMREPPRLDDVRIVLPPTAIPLDAPPVDHRPMFVGAGLVVLAMMFWWNRRRRDRFEQEDRLERSEPGARRPRGRPRPAARDDDADDLHAAARGDPPDEPDRTAPDPASPADRDQP
jgi:hypothetical protein